MFKSRFSFITIVALVAAGCNRPSAEPGDAAPVGTAGERAEGRAEGCAPVETRAPNAPDQRPAFAGQTRACDARSNVAFDVVVLAKGLEHPWAVEPLPGGDLLVTEKPGRMRIVSADGRGRASRSPACRRSTRAARAGCSTWRSSPTFATDRTIFWSYSEPREGGNGTSVARGVLSADGTRWRRCA